MKIAVFGGSFNPLHAGHAMLADTVIKECGYDKVLFVPAFMPPHKILADGVTAQQRLEMLDAFCNSEGAGHFEVEPCEIERGGISYTCDTLEYLTQKYKGKLDGKLALIMGSEVAAEFDKWYKPERIAQLADFIIVHRYPDINTMEKYMYGKGQGDDAHHEQAITHDESSNTPTGTYKGDFAVSFDEEHFKYPCKILPEPMLPLSSTEIRQRVSQEKSFKYLVPQAVYKYIIEKGLYTNK